MLEIRNLTKVYRSKTGESVRALDNVSVSFPESGMVFILGKSGSGKSTLLNVMGGLDSYDSGEFIIKGKSSKNFMGSDFDAYRNTFIGFIFQEYNILDDFTVGANIALALELQGKKATPEKINGILSQVDLVNYAKRKPNELSGGQKQRVAIARALVKEPQIIMADEPTGALDSNTGKAIFDTLKKLSEEKLVLIVSHDRDFAEKYADRIIELADGKIISDVTKHEHESQKISEGIDKISGQILRIKGGYKLTETDLKMINEYLAQNSEDVILSSDGRVNSELRSAAGITEQGNMSVFEGTEPERDVKLRTYEKKDSKFIRSRLPMKNAVRMGASGLKHKKFRLVMTIFLSLIAFVMFGFADTMAAYQKITATTDSIIDSNIKNASVTLGVRHTSQYGDSEPYTYYNSAYLNEEDIEWLSKETGLNFVPVYTGDIWSGGFSVSNLMTTYDHNTVYSGKIHGLVGLTESEMSSTGFSITGRMPQKAGEIAITELLYRQFNHYGFNNSNFDETVAAGSLTMDADSQNSIIG
ncbi:MAG: ABC transporter ATP-binding protein, partial [Clostridia bacterium]|nr:ABC transporter ATP-binding protein [Clostridia bacterium]